MNSIACASQRYTHVNTHPLTAPRCTVRHTTFSQVEADVVLYDLSPALGVTTELTLMHCDYFIVPCEINKLCEKNVSSIPDIFKKWYHDACGVCPLFVLALIMRGVIVPLLPPALYSSANVSHTVCHCVLFVPS